MDRRRIDLSAKRLPVDCYALTSSEIIIVISAGRKTRLLAFSTKYHAADAFAKLFRAKP